MIKIIWKMWQQGEVSGQRIVGQGACRAGLEAAGLEGQSKKTETLSYSGACEQGSSEELLG